MLPRRGQSYRLPWLEGIPPPAFIPDPNPLRVSFIEGGGLTFREPMLNLTDPLLLAAHTEPSLVFTEPARHPAHKEAFP